MKKFFSILLIICFSVLFLFGCSSDDSDKESGKKAKGSSKESSVVEKKNKKANISETVILDKDGIKVTAKSIEYDRDDVDIKLLIENNSSKNVTVQTDGFSINGIMIDPIFSADVAAGKKANDSISIYGDYLERANITTIKDIEFSLRVFDSDTWDDIFIEKGITLTTDAKDYVQKYNTEGFLAVDQNGIKIYVLKLDDKDSFWGADITVYIENNSDKVVTVQARDVSINGFMIDPLFSSTLEPGKKAYDEMSFMESDLEENDIKDITSIELKFKAYDDDSWDDIFNTENIKIEF